MLRKYKKTHAPSWQRKLVILVSALLGATFLLFAVWSIMLFADRSRGDACLDRGGTYDYERGQCDRESIPETGSF
jgi:hypothetical protein